MLNFSEANGFGWTAWQLTPQCILCLKYNKQWGCNLINFVGGEFRLIHKRLFASAIFFTANNAIFIKTYLNKKNFKSEKVLLSLALVSFDHFYRKVCW